MSLINFRKNSALLNHRKKQKKLISEIVELNINIEKKIRDWELLNQKNVNKEHIYNLPEEIQKLLFQYKANEKFLIRKSKIEVNDA